MTMWKPDLTGRREPRYLAIANSLADDIAAGRLRPGDRLPTHRCLASQLGVTVGTVTRGYGEAEQRGLIRGEVGRGSFVASGVPEPVRLQINENDGDRIDLSLNYPVYAQDPDLGPTLARLSKREDLAELMRYQPAEGMRRHRIAGADWASRFGIDVPPERILVTAGAQHAMTTLFTTLTRPGDLVLTEALTYPGMKSLAALLNLRLEPVAIDRQGLIPEAFEAACRRNEARVLYCMPNLHNPTNATMPAERRRQVAAIARQHGISIVEDDVHGLLLPRRHPPIGHWAPECSFFIASMSKAVAGGLRTSFLAVPPGMVDPLAQAIGATIWLGSPLTTEIAAMWIADGTADRIVTRKRREAMERQKIAREILGRFRPIGAPSSYHVWLELDAPWRGEQFAAAAERRGVIVSSADRFVVGRSPMPHAVRISLGGARNRRTLEKGLRTLAAILDRPPAPGRTIV